MNDSTPTLALDEGLDLKKVVTTGSVLQINFDYEDNDDNIINDKEVTKDIDFIGEPVVSCKTLAKQLVPVDETGNVKKKIIEEGGGMPLHDGCTVSIAYSGYWENVHEPFDVRKSNSPLVIDLKDNGLLPGLQIAVRSMLVGEISIFLLSYRVMFGEMGAPPRIKPKADCVFYIKLMKSILTPQHGVINFSEPNMFQRVYHDVHLLYGSGVTLHKSNNTNAAVQLFRKGVFMLQKCRLADEEEEKKRDALLVKLYINLAICYNIIGKPLKACTACNELNRLNCLWNSGKTLLHNARALRMIGQFDDAEKRLKRAMNLCPNRPELDEEYQILKKVRDDFNTKTQSVRNLRPSMNLVSDEFKRELDNLLKSFKENDKLHKFCIPFSLNSHEAQYLKEACIRENLFCGKNQEKCSLSKNEENENSECILKD